MLSPYRVLDLTDERGEMAGMVLADLGADVVRVEPPGGCASRFAVPRLESGPADARGLGFAAYSRGKRSIALDPAVVADREVLLGLVAGADFVLESGAPTWLEEHGIDFEQLRRVSPRVVCVQVTAFGSDGPRSRQPASDLTLAALGGPMSLQGERDRPPLRISVPQAWRQAGAEAAVAALIGHAQVRATGEACRIDVSAQTVMTWTMLNGMTASAIQGHDFERDGSDLQLGNVRFRLVYPCRDGHVVVLPTGDTLIALLPWMLEEGAVDPDWVAREDWSTHRHRVFRGEAYRITPAELSDVLAAFFATHTKRELLERGLALGATLAPVQTVADLIEFPQLESRDFFAPLELPDGTRVRAPGAFARPARTPLRRPRPAPRLDEHRDEILRELGAGAWRGGADPGPRTGGELPLSGLRVADFSWVGVGPISGRYLADHGATVVRVESASRADALRSAGPFKDEKPGWNRSHYYGEFNTSKKSLALDLRHPDSSGVAEDLLRWADVYLESFTPGTVDRLGLGYERARELNPSIVMVSTCLMGQTGPIAAMAGYGYHAAAVAGFYELTGWPDRAPVGPWQAYTDTIAPRLLTATLLAALDHRRRTGEGQHIDVGQMEAALQLLAPELIECQVSGTCPRRIGNRSRFAAPQGVYPCAGDDQWCAIAIDSDAQWRALRAALGEPDWARDPALDAVEARLARHDELDAALADWTRTRAAAQVMETLAAAGVPAGVVQRSSDLLRDPQLAQRGFHVELDHAEMGRIPYSGRQFRIDGQPGGPRGAAPTLGGDSYEVLHDLLGLDDERIAQLLAGGAIA